MPSYDERIRGERILRELNTQWAQERQREIEDRLRALSEVRIQSGIVRFLVLVVILFILLRWLL